MLRRSDFILGAVRGLNKGVMWTVDWEDRKGGEGGKLGLVQHLTHGKCSWFLLHK